MGVIESALKWAKQIADDNSHGYDQSSRWGPDYDCSSLMISAYKQAGLPLKSTYTGNMRSDFLANGFKDVTSSINLPTGAGLLPGDVLLQERNHTAMYIGNGKLLHAAGNENGGATGGKTGDQTGREICVANYFNYNPGGWDCVLRYSEADVVKDEPITAPGSQVYTVQSGDSLWTIAQRFLGAGIKYQEIMAANGLTSSMIHVGQKLKIPGVTDARTISITVSATTYEALAMTAESEHKTIGEVIDGFFIQP